MRRSTISTLISGTLLGLVIAIMLNLLVGDIFDPQEPPTVKMVEPAPNVVCFLSGGNNISCLPKRMIPTCEGCPCPKP